MKLLEIFEVANGWIAREQTSSQYGMPANYDRTWVFNNLDDLGRFVVEYYVGEHDESN